jgi:hypothetical protein
MPMPHLVRQNADAHFCPRCAASWSLGEDPPNTPCIDTRGDDRETRRVKGTRVKLKAVS